MNNNFQKFLALVDRVSNFFNNKIYESYDDNKKLINLFKDYQFLFSNDYDTVLLTQETTKKLYDQYKKIDLSKTDSSVLYRVYEESLVYADKMRKQAIGDCISKYNHNFLAYEILKDISPVNFYKAFITALKNKNKDMVHRFLKQNDLREKLIFASDAKNIHGLYSMIGQEMINVYNPTLLDWFLNLKDVKLYLNYPADDNKVYSSYLYKACINKENSPQANDCFKVLKQNNMLTYGILEEIDALRESVVQKEVVKKIISLALPEKLNKDLKNDHSKKAKFKI